MKLYKIYLQNVYFSENIFESNYFPNFSYQNLNILSETILNKKQSFQNHALKLVFQNSVLFEILMALEKLQGYCFNKAFSNAASCLNDDSTISILT